MEEKKNGGQGHGGKMVAPVVITVILAVYYLFFAALCLFVEGIPLIARILCWVSFLWGLVGVMIFVLVERLREIRSGEEDDLSKY